MPDNLDISNNVEVVEECTQKIADNKKNFVLSPVTLKACNGVVGDDNCSDLYEKGVTAAQKYQEIQGALIQNMTLISNTLVKADESVAAAELGNN